MSPATPIYANNAGTSWPKAPTVPEAVADALRADPSGYGRMFERWRDEIAARFGVERPPELVLTPGCTSALAGAILSLPWAPGDIVVTSALEHDAMLAPIRVLRRLRGVVHQSVGGAPFDVDELRSVARGGRVRLVAVTAASNVTGERVDVESIAAVAHEHGALALVDAAQIAGLVPVDVEALGVDMLAFAGHKGPLGPQGIGGLWIAPGVDFGEGGLRPGYCDLGSAFLAGAAGLAAGLRWLASAGESPAIALAQRLRASLRSHPRCTIVGGEGPSTATVSIVIDGLAVPHAESHFATRGIVLRAGRHCAPQALETLGYPGGTIRISFGPFNRESDVDAIVAAI